MAIVSFDLPPLGNMIQSSSPQSVTINATDAGTGVIFPAPKTGNIDKVIFNVTTRTSTDKNLRVGIQGVTTTRVPDGTFKGSGSSFVDVIPAATGQQVVTLGAVAAVTLGDSLSIVILGQDASVNLAVARGTQTPNIQTTFPITKSGGTWSYAFKNFMPLISCSYDDGTILEHSIPYATLVNNVWNTGSSPLYRGNAWTPAATCRCNGVWICVRPPDTGNFTIKVFAGTSNTVLASYAVDPDTILAGNDQNYPFFCPFTAITLTAGTTYRFIVEPTTVNNQSEFCKATYGSSAQRTAHMGGLYYSTTTSISGTITWTDDTSAAAMLIPSINGVDASSAVIVIED